MGISDFLSRMLEAAGRPCDLRTYAEGVVDLLQDQDKRQRRRPLRIGVDVSSWVYQAAHGYGDMLGDERHLTNYGRAALHTQAQQQRGTNNTNTSNNASSSLEPAEEQIEGYIQACTKHVLSRLEILRDTTNADVLIVLDGPSPPIKAQESQRRREQRRQHEVLRERPVDPAISPTKTNAQRTRANRRAGAGRYQSRITRAVVRSLQEAQLPYLVSPYEADAQLAYLSDQEYIDLVMTEDSDLVAHGAKSILYKSLAELGSHNAPRGKLLQFADIGAGLAKWNLMEFTPVMMTLLFVAVGCDYCDKLQGIGLVTAARIIRKAFLTTPSGTERALNKHTSSSRVGRVLQELYMHSYLTKNTLTPQFKIDYEERFLASIFMYRHPIVYDPVQCKCLLATRRRITPDTGADDQMSMDGSSEKNAEDDHDDNKQDDPLHGLGDDELMDHIAYTQLCGDFERIQAIVGRLETSSKEATCAAQGLHWLRKDSPAATSTTIDDAAEEPDGGVVGATYAVGLQAEEASSRDVATPAESADAEGGLQTQPSVLLDQHIGSDQAAGEETKEEDTSDEERLSGTQPYLNEENDDESMTQQDDDDLQTQDEQAIMRGASNAAAAAKNQESTGNDDSGGSPHSENLLYSTTPDKTQASSATGSTSKQSQSLLYSTTPETATQQLLGDKEGEKDFVEGDTFYACPPDDKA